MLELRECLVGFKIETVEDNGNDRILLHPSREK